MYDSTLALTSVVDGVSGDTTLRPLYLLERPGTHCVGVWEGSRAGLDGRGKSRPHRNSIPGPSSPLRLAIPQDYHAQFIAPGRDP